jgi:xylulokinase
MVGHRRSQGRYLIGIDVGTTGARAVVIDARGRLVASATEEYPLYSPKPSWAEQEPADWWGATKLALRRVLASRKVKAAEVAGVGLTGQMHGSVFLDRDNRVIRPAILWCDQRTQPQCDAITSKVGKRKLIELACNPALTGFTAPKILWLREHEPRNYDKVQKVLLPKDYIRFLLTGEYATEVSDASGTLLLDVRKRSWSKEILSKLDIPLEFLPSCEESTVVTGSITKKAAEQTGLVAGTPVVGGGGDQAAGAVGTGIVRRGIVSSTVGTSGVVFAFSDKVMLDPKGRVHTFCHAVPGKWHVMGVMLSAGGSLRWYRDTFCGAEKEVASLEGRDPYELIIEEAATAPAGCEGLLFVPYLTGERTPHADANAKGVFFGIHLRHTKAHFARSVLEGVAFGLKDSFEIIKSMGVPMDEVRASGGGARSKLWRQIQADVNDLPLVTINVDEGPAYGAALLAGVGAKVFRTVEEACDASIKVVSRMSPRKKTRSLYARYYKEYCALYPALKARFAAVADS